MSLRLDPFLNCNRLLKEDWEDREYDIHQKRLKEIQNRRNKTENVKFPPIINNSKKNQKNKEKLDEFEREDQIVEKRIYRVKHKPPLDHWNSDYDRLSLFLSSSKEASRNKVKSEIDIENERLAKRLQNTKGAYDIKKWDKEFENHQIYLGINNGNRFYTPRGMGHRKSKSLPEMRHDRTKNKNKNAIKMLNEAVKQLERGDVVLMKTLCTLNYLERMETKRKYEEAYDTDLKKGLAKVMDKQYEPLINALLTDVHSVDVDRIYESLYDPHDACITITEAIVSRSNEQKKDLLDAFESKIDSSLGSEISEKIEGELRTFLLAFIENNKLDKDRIDEKKAEADANSLSRNLSFTSDLFLKILRSYPRKQFNELFLSYQEITGNDILSQVDANKPVNKAVKLIQSYVTNSVAFKAEKLQKSFKSNKSEFLRLLAYYPKNELQEILNVYNKKYQTSIDDDIKNNFSPEVSRLVLRMIRRYQDNEEE